MENGKEWYSSNLIITCKSSRVVPFKVFIDDKQVGKIKDKHFLYLKLNEGKHSLYFKGLLYKSKVYDFEIKKPYFTDITFNLCFKEKVEANYLTIGQRAERMHEVLIDKKNKPSKKQSNEYKSYTDEEMDTYDLLDGD